MKRTKKSIMASGLAAFLVLASSVTGFAEDRQGESGWKVEFDGKKLESNFSTANMDDEIYNMQPGDSVELTISLKNSYDKGEVDWYMKNQVLQTLEDAGSMSGGAYDYLLTYKDKDGKSTTLYSSEKFGGEGRYNGVGLKGATTTLDDYFYLDRMGKDDTGVVTLKVALDAETLVNDYQNTLARLQMDFATELVDTTTTGNPSTPGSGRSPVKTGDQTKIMLYIVLTLAAGLVLLILGIMRLRRDREEEPETADGPKMSGGAKGAAGMKGSSGVNRASGVRNMSSSSGAAGGSGADAAKRAQAKSGTRIGTETDSGTGKRRRR